MSEVNGINRDIEWIRESLERIEQRFDSMDTGCRERYQIIDRELAALRVKAGMYGAIAGAAPAIVAAILFLLQKL